MSDTAFGFILGCLSMGITLFIVLHACCDNEVSNYALNNPKYKIDTTMIIKNDDTTYTYNFVKKGE